MEGQLTKLQKDALTEIVTIGAGNAATALSQMLKKKVDIKIPKVDMCHVKDAPKVFGTPELLVTSVYLQILGEMAGVMLFSFHKEEANRLADLLFGKKPGNTKLINDLAGSALKETATILSGAYLSAISKVLKLRILLSAPGLAHDMAGAIVDAILAETSKEADYAIVINTELSIVDEKVQAYFFFIPDSESLEQMMNIMGVSG